MSKRTWDFLTAQRYIKNNKEKKKQNGIRFKFFSYLCSLFFPNELCKSVKSSNIQL
jgi:hypothetical protein